MAEDSEAEKTEPASERRLEQAREEGDVPRSREIGTFAILMTAGLTLWATGPGMARALSHNLASGMRFTREQAFHPDILMMRLATDLVPVLLAMAPLALAVLIVAAASPLVIGGWLFSAKALQPDFMRLSPLRGLGNMFSKNAMVELIKAILKTVLVGAVAWGVIAFEKDAVFALALQPVREASLHTLDLLLMTFLFVAGALGLIAVIDGPYQVWHYAEKLKMTRQEVIQESKESDGNPQIKAKIRSMQREMARRRMMAAVPSADVVVTNPTHFAVALKYVDGKMRAPQVVAKGADEVAAKIRELAQENKVAILEAPPLARALYKHADIGDEIPQALYTAVAEVLAYVFQLRMYQKGEGERPQAPRELDVPPEMDPLQATGQPPAAPA
ncbi:flagellar biosynthesis protein FlhB [Massilia sp. W12]|uniref:flagellar biosynthesis protein FlhB n=1 Tax=Massilia sp. W12 TaxID=3126507 RepID=UPI0030CE3BDB